MTLGNNRTRRDFIQVVGATPSLALLPGGANQVRAATADKFSPIELSPYFNTSLPALIEIFGPSTREELAELPTGGQIFRGIPFVLGPGANANSFLLLRQQDVEVPLGGKRAGYICVAHFCDRFETEFLKTGEEDVDRSGERLADAALVFADGSEAVYPIRRRFEVSSPRISWGQLCFAALPHRSDGPSGLDDSLAHGRDWGELQTAVVDRAYGGSTVWLWAMPNPHPERALKSLRLRGAGGPLVVCGLTLFHGDENPLRYLRLRLYRITLPEGGADEKDRWNVSVDLGVVARTYTSSEFNPETWLAAADAGIGAREQPAKGARHLFVEVAAAANATLSLRDARTKRQYQFELVRAVPGREIDAAGSAARIEVIEAHKTWLHGKVIDSTTGRPTPVRMAFRSAGGRYIPPYGHRTEINDGWFQDYGADVKLMDSSFAYIDGTFQVELPVGEVYVELSKGFEYGTVRRRLNIESGQRELNLQVSRFVDLRAQGWMTADTHVHFLSPSTAVLEGQAEGLNLVNLLAAQWGDLFTNVGDLPQGPLSSQDGEMTVWVGTENRQHLLGHLGLLGGHGEPVYPMSSSGPSEAYLGDPVRTSLADWADACRKREGLVVAVHFPYPTAELAADMVLGKIDAVEIYPYGEHFNTLRLRDWYRYLNCGYRVPCVGGTDKMGAYMPVGANRTYAYVGKEQLSFENWAKAVRRGNTFCTTGPLLLLRVDGSAPGDEIEMTGSGTLQAQVDARGSVPFHKVELIQNGRVVASREATGGTRELRLDEKIQVSGPAWIAARCASKYGPTTNWGLGIQAHTSPVYVRVPGQELFSGPAASYMLTLVEGARTWLDTLATRPDPERLARVQSVFERAKQHLHERLHKHGIKH